MTNSPESRHGQAGVPLWLRAVEPRSVQLVTTGALLAGGEHFLTGPEAKLSRCTTRQKEKKSSYFSYLNIDCFSQTSGFLEPNDSLGYYATGLGIICVSEHLTAQELSGDTLET